MAWPPPANATRSTAPPSSSPPTKASLKAWWKHFTFAQRIKKEAGQTYRSPAMPKNSTVFGIPLHESLKYANVHISTANANGELYVWGYIPVVVAKCGLYLKENGTEVEGTFRVSGSNKRMRDLQALFDTPPRYGKDLDWSKNTFTTHDVASVFRRYLTQMPEPVIPYSRYLEFREVLARDPPLREEAAIAAYKKLILSLPRPNQYLLLYVLDLLSVFARKSEINRMTAENLAVIFRPGILNHPSHEMVPTEHRLNQQVLEFLIAHQDWFMLDVPPPQRNDSILGPLTLPQPKRDIYAMPSQTVGEHGEWEGKNVANSIGRRRTTNDHRSVVDKRSEDDNGIEFSGRKQGAILEGGEDVILGTGDVSVKRSRTHPSKHSTSGRSVTRGTQDDTMASRKGSIRKPVPS